MARESSHDSPSRDCRILSADTGQSPDGSEVRAIKRNSNRETGKLDSESRATVVWRCFDSETEVAVAARNRPHWDQNGAVTFVTFRMADSMPKAVVQRWLEAQDEWLKRHGINSGGREAALAGAPEPLRRAFLKFKNKRWHENLDNCHGSCLLRKSHLAKIVADSLLKFDGERYDLERFVVMPNHVHLLVQMRPGWKLREQCASWLRFTGRRINTLNGTSGQFWSEPFDHIVRNEGQFSYLQNYIDANPTKAKLPEGGYLLWIRNSGFVLSHDSPRCESSGSELDSENRATKEGQ